jgi:NAD(P)-dependent dehydrogenase (short-subunit alcohol dehydrogenase family)
MSNFTKDSTASQVAATLAANITNKIVLITGCSPNGLGATAAMAIAPHKPGLIILTRRTRSLIEETERAILAKTPHVKTRLLIFDFANLKSVRETTAEVNKYPEISMSLSTMPGLWRLRSKRQLMDLRANLV